jgi:hypothetical protein
MTYYFEHDGYQPTPKHVVEINPITPSTKLKLSRKQSTIR